MIYKGDRVFTTNIPFLQPNAIQITFADFLLFQNARDEYTAPKLVDYPHILALGKALVQRPNIQKYRPDLLD
jgi:hypothetical protein